VTYAANLSPFHTNIMLTLMKIYRELKQKRRLQEGKHDKRKTLQTELTIREASLLISYRKHKRTEELNEMCCKVFSQFQCLLDLVRFLSKED